MPINFLICRLFSHNIAQYVRHAVSLLYRYKNTYGHQIWIRENFTSSEKWIVLPQLSLKLNVLIFFFYVNVFLKGLFQKKKGSVRFFLPTPFFFFKKKSLIITKVAFI